MKTFSLALVALLATSVAGTGTQFITGPCSSDADCQSSCCGFNSGLCAGAIIAQERDGGCGHGDPQPNNNAAVALGSTETALEDEDDCEDSGEPPAPAPPTPPQPSSEDDSECDGGDDEEAAAAPSSAASASPAQGGPPFDPAGTKNVGNGNGQQFIGGQCLSSADCGSGCCAGPSGICSGPGASLQNGKTGCGFPNVSAAGGSSVAAADASAATPSGVLASPANGGPAFDPAGVKNVGNGKGQQFIGGQCLNTADCGSGCCAFPSGICSGPGAAFQAGKQGCGFPGNGSGSGTSAASSQSVANKGVAASSTLSIAPEEATAIDGGLPAGAVAGGEDPNAQIIPSSGEGSQSSGNENNDQGAKNASATKGSSKDSSSSTLSIAPEEATAIDGGLPAGAVAGGEIPNAQIIPSSGEGSQSSGNDNQSSSSSTTSQGSGKNTASSTLSIAPEEATAIDGGLPAGAVAGGEIPNAQIIPSSGEGSDGGSGASAGQGSGKNAASTTLSIAPEEATAINGGLPAGAVAGGEEPNAQIIPSSGEGSQSSGNNSGNSQNAATSSQAGGSGQATATVSIAPEEATAIDGGLPAGAVAGGEDPNAQIIPSSGEGSSNNNDSNGSGKAAATTSQASGSGQGATPTVSIAPEEGTPIDGGLPAGAVAGGEDPSATIIPAKRMPIRQRGNGIFTMSFEA